MRKNRFLSAITAATILSTGMFFTGCAAGNEASATPAKHAAHAKMNVIKYEKALALHKAQGALFIDARGSKLYKKSTIMGAINVPTKAYGKLKKYLPSKDTAIVTFCNGFACEKAEELAHIMMKDGFTNVMVYRGGQPEWEEKKQIQMGIKKECKAAPASTSAYKPPLAATEANGVKIHLLPEDGEANEDGVIDQFWFNEQIKNGTVPKGVHIVDVRKAERYAVSHIEGAISIPFKDDAIDASKFPEDGIVVFYCNTGMKSTDARGSIDDDDLLERVFIFDATYKCDDKFDNCKITPNEAL